VDLRLRSNEARPPFPRKPSGRRIFWLWPALARPLQPDAGMLRSRHLGQSQNLSSQDPTQFSDRLLAARERKDDGQNPLRSLRSFAAKVSACGSAVTLHAPRSTLDVLIAPSPDRIADDPRRSDLSPPSRSRPP